MERRSSGPAGGSISSRWRRSGTGHCCSCRPCPGTGRPPCRPTTDAPRFWSVSSGSRRIGRPQPNTNGWRVTSRPRWHAWPRRRHRPRWPARSRRPARSGWLAANANWRCCRNAGIRPWPGWPVSSWSPARPVSARAGCWTNSPRWSSAPGPTPCAPAVSPLAGGLPSPRCRSGCAARRCGRPASGWSRCGPARSTGSCRRPKPTPWPSRAPWPTPGSATGSWRAWPGRCCRLAGPPCWCWTISSGATRTPSPGCSCCCTSARVTRYSCSPRAGRRRPRETPSSPRRCGRCGRQARSPTWTWRRWIPLAPPSSRVRFSAPCRWAGTRSGCTRPPVGTRCSSSN